MGNISYTGELVDYCATIKNKGLDPCFNAIGVFNIPSGMSIYEVKSVSTGVYHDSTFTWRIGNLKGAKKGLFQEEQICLKLKIEDISQAPFSVSASFYSDCTDDPLNNTNIEIFALPEEVEPEPEPYGACCISDTSCVNTTEVGCNTIEGRWKGALTDCDTVSCDRRTLLDNACFVRINETKVFELTNLHGITESFNIPIEQGERFERLISVSANGTVRDKNSNLWGYSQTGLTIDFNYSVIGTIASPAYVEVIYVVSANLGEKLGFDCSDLPVPLESVKKKAGRPKGSKNKKK